jgi:DNA polymerase I-like protein with 3'-5' exonuclease and polymerase domains/uracil-DNA glycosylase
LKILFLQEYMRESHIRQENSGEISNIFLSTKGGSILKKLVKDGLGLSYDDFYIDYAYGLVPKVITRDKYGKAVKYKQPTAREANAEYEYLYRKIVSEKPDIIIPTGNLGCKALIGKSSISQLRGVPVKSAFSNGQENFETWIMPMYSMEYMLVNPSVQNLIEADFVTLKKFVDTGEAAFEASPVEYEFVTSMERVREIFNVEVTKAPSVAWDLETNTLHPELRGAKPLVVSLSWEEGTGCTIPLEHKDFTWNFYELDEIYKLLEDFVGNPDIPKEGHNIKYDMRFLRLTKGFKRFRNNRDTMIMYYLLINQEVESSLRLSDLSYELTDMGGYDKALEEYKKKFIEDSIETAKAIKEKMQEEHKKAQAAEKALAKVERRKAIKLEKPEYPSTAAPVNEIDGEDFNYEWIPLVEMIHPYASGDVDACLRIFNRLDAIGQKPENAKIRQLYLEHYPELINVLAKIEANGIMMDTAYTEGLIEAYTKESDRLVEEMRIFPEVQQLEAEHLALYQRGLEEMAIPKQDRNEEIADLRDKYKKKLVFNPNSSDDKKKILFQYTGNTLPYNKEMIVESALENNIPEDEIEWFHYKADKVALAYVVENYPESKELAALLLEHSKVKTLKQNFTYKLLAMIDHDGLLHGGFNPAGTATSRLSSSSPNLQQMPRKTGDVYRFDYHHPIKRMFVTSFEGGALIQADYSSLESRVLALAAYDEEMIQAFLDNVDIHRETASLVFGIPKEQVTDDQRSSAKSTTFGIAYGETPFSYYAKHGMTLDQAEKLFEDFFRNKPRIKMFIDENHAQVKQDGHVECLQGFRRNLRDVYSQDRSKQNGALRQSVNTKIQGSGAFLTNTAVIYINKFIEEHNLRSKLVLTVHDSIVCDSPPEEIHIMSRAIIFIMENLPIDWLFIDWKGEKLRFPIAADLEIGVNYNDMVDYNMEEINSFQTVKSYCKFKLDLKKIKNYKESKAITEEKFDAMKAAIENNKPQYQMAI